MGSLASWENLPGASFNALGTWQGNAAFIGSWIIILGSLTIIGFFREFQSRRLYLGSLLGGSGSTITLIGAVSFLFNGSPGSSPAWGLYLSIIFSSSALFSSTMIYLEHKGSPAVKHRGGGIPKT